MTTACLLVRVEKNGGEKRARCTSVTLTKSKEDGTAKRQGNQRLRGTCLYLNNADIPFVVGNC